MVMKSYEVLKIGTSAVKNLLGIENAYEVYINQINIVVVNAEQQVIYQPKNLG